MILILLAVMFTAVACVIAWYLATWALPVMVAVETFRFIHATEAGFLLSVLAAGIAALLSVGLVLLVLFKAQNPILCLLARAVFVIPAMIAGYPRHRLGSWDQYHERESQSHHRSCTGCR